MAPFMRRGATVNPASAERLPPPPPQPALTHPPMTLQQAGVKMDAAKRGELSALAKERDEQRTRGNTSLEAWRGLLDRAQCLFRGLALPANISRLVRQAFAVRTIHGRTTETVVARVLAKA